MFFKQFGLNIQLCEDKKMKNVIGKGACITETPDGIIIDIYLHRKGDFVIENVKDGSFYLQSRKTLEEKVISPENIIQTAVWAG